MLRQTPGRVALQVFLFLSVMGAAVPLPAADSGSAPTSRSRFFDPDDGWLDISGFLDTAYGFVPLVAPITEPAVGYGAVGALVFIDRNPPVDGQRYVRPNIGVIGGLGTENGTRGAFAVHLGSWMEGRLRTLVGLADANVNLDFFGLGGDRAPGEAGVGYTIAMRGGAAGASYRLGESSLWVGLRYGMAKTDVTGNEPGSAMLGIAPPDLDLRLAAITPSITLDMRDNFFTPTQGWYADLTVPFFREALGSDRDFRRANLTAMYFQPLASSIYFSVRGSGKSSSEGTPFFLRPYVALRGVQALRYQGEKAAEGEAELRWQLHPRFSLVGFVGAGAARNSAALRDREKTVAAGGVGFRYFLARKHGLHMGMDVAQGPDKPILYMVFGNAWIRP
jgi:hypothetical protein